MGQHLINYLFSLAKDIAGKNSQDGQATLEVYDNKAIKYSAITFETDSPVDGGPERQRVEVRTRVPKKYVLLYPG